MHHNIRGYERWNVLIYKIKQPSKIVSQLIATHTASPGLVNLEDMRLIHCEQCGISKHLWGFEKTIMKLHRDALVSNVDMMETDEWFGGEGWTANKELLISNRLAQLILDNKWKGVRMKVVDLVD